MKTAIKTSLSILTALTLSAGVSHAQTCDIGQKTQIETGFSPEGNANALVIKTIREAKGLVLMSAYSLTSSSIGQELLAAQKRGVHVGVIGDYKASRLKKEARILSQLIAGGARVALLKKYAIAHDKYIVTDASNIETGSFNYTEQAAQKNRENVVLIHNICVADIYHQHWLAMFKQGERMDKNY